MSMTEPIRIISATRTTADTFETQTYLGRSLQQLSKLGDFQKEIAFENTQGLPTVYNRAIQRAKDDPAILVFIHDDAYIADTLWIDEIRQRLTQFDVLGLAGNRRRVPHQPAWAFIGFEAINKLVWDSESNRSGTVAHGELPGKVAHFGLIHQPCVLLDGLMMVARSSVLNERGVGFDAQFDFHFYDMDFSRQAELKGLKMGTTAIKVVHRSDGAFGTRPWMDAYVRYLQKYGS